MSLRRRLLMMATRIQIYYGKALPRRSTGETDYNTNGRRAATSAINVNAGDTLTITPPDGYRVALGVWIRRTSGGTDNPELYGGWDANLNYTVQNNNCYARYVFRTIPTENIITDNALQNKVKIHVNGKLYFA